MTEKKPFAKQAAQASWAIPLITLGMMMFVNSAMASGGKVAVAFLSVIFLITGIVLAIIGIAGTRKHGRAGLLVPGLAGILFNGLLLSLLLV